jgi:hypothetical protein
MPSREGAGVGNAWANADAGERRDGCGGIEVRRNRGASMSTVRRGTPWAMDDGHATDDHGGAVERCEPVATARKAERKPSPGTSVTGAFGRGAPAKSSGRLRRSGRVLGLVICGRQQHAGRFDER